MILSMIPKSFNDIQVVKIHKSFVVNYSVEIRKFFVLPKSECPHFLRSKNTQMLLGGFTYNLILIWYSLAEVKLPKRHLGTSTSIEKINPAAFCCSIIANRIYYIGLYENHKLTVTFSTKIQFKGFAQSVIVPLLSGCPRERTFPIDSSRLFLLRRMKSNYFQ